MIDRMHSNRVHLLTGAVQAALSRVAPDARDAIAADLAELLRSDDAACRESAESVLRALAEARKRDDVAEALVNLTFSADSRVAAVAEDALATLVPDDPALGRPDCPPLPALILAANTTSANLSAAEREHVDICAHCRSVLALAAESGPAGTPVSAPLDLLVVGRRVLRSLADAFGEWAPSQLATGTVRAAGSQASGPAGAEPGPASGVLEEATLEQMGLTPEYEYRIQAGEGGRITLVVDFKPLRRDLPTTATVQLVRHESREVVAHSKLRGRGRVRRVVFANLPVSDQEWPDISVEIEGTEGAAGG